MLDYQFLQYYWWIIISLLGGFLSSLFFVQGGQSLFRILATNREEKEDIIEILEGKWEYTFTTLVLFGGAIFAAFPLFYAVSFGGAYLAWMLLLFTFVLQAVSYEFRNKLGNLLGERCYETFLLINGIVAPFLFGVVLTSLYTGSPFRLSQFNEVSWDSPFKGVDLLFTMENLIGGMLFLLISQIISLLYLVKVSHNINIINRAQKWVRGYRYIIVIMVLLYLDSLSAFGYSVGDNGVVSFVQGKYIDNVITYPIIGFLLLVGSIMVSFSPLFATFKRVASNSVWIASIGATLFTFALFLIVGINNTPFYPSSIDPNSSLTIFNASSSHYTLNVMFYVSFFVPIVLGYIFYVWKILTK